MFYQTKEVIFEKNEDIRRIAEEYARSFYVRPDGDDREWEEYRDTERGSLVNIFRALFDAGSSVRRLIAIYSETSDSPLMCEVMVILDLENPPELDVDHIRRMVKGLEGDQGNLVLTMGCGTNMVVIQEQY